METLSLLWSRVALSFYALGLGLAIAALLRRRESSARWARGLVGIGFIFHFVSLVEMGIAAHHFPATQFSEASSLLAFIITAFFLAIYRLYAPPALSVIVFPCVFLLTFSSIYAPHGQAYTGPSHYVASLDNQWVYWHVLFVFLGYAALVLAFAGGVLYLIAERGLKARPVKGITRLLPPLETLDQIAYRSLLTGFPLLTLGLGIGAYFADAEFGTFGLRDPRVLLAFLTWGFYLALLFSRWSAGWRGRRAAYFTIICFSLAVVGWVSSSLTGMHRFLMQ